MDVFYDMELETRTVTHDEHYERELDEYVSETGAWRLAQELEGE